MHSTLISTSSLVAHLDDGAWVICDCRHDLADIGAGRRAHAEAHIPGARFVHVDEDLSAPKTGRNGRHPLPDPETFVRRLGELGISNASPVVAYDASGGPYAARLWWMLCWLGHESVAVLDGGWNSWLKAGLPATASSIPVKPARYLRRAALVRSVTAEEIMHDSAATQRRLLDARAPNRYRGENETLDPVAGHIPGAANRFFQLNLDAEGKFKPASTLKQEFSTLLGSAAPEAVTHYCGSGVTACHNLLAMEAAGLSGSRLYPGSWSEWCSDPSRPVATGET